MMRFSYAFGSLALGSIAACGSKAGPTAPNLGDCTNCVITTGGMHGTGGAGTEADAGDPPSEDAAAPSSDAGAVTVKLSLLRMLAEPTFSKDPMMYTGAVKVSAFDPSGGVVDTGAAGALLPQDLEGVASGRNWFAVQDANSTVTIASTLQLVDVGAGNPTVALSALNAGLLAASNIDGDLVMGPAQGQAAVVLVFRKGDKAVSGVSVSGAPAAASVGYYTGTPYPYQTKAKGTDATGSDSTVLIAHIPASAQFPNLNKLSLSWSVGNQAPSNLEVNVAQAFVTWMLVEVP